MSTIIHIMTRLTIFAALLATASASAAQPEWIYPVRSGDTLIEIANLYLARPAEWEKLQQLNQISDPRHLQTDSQLRIPVSLLKREAAGAVVLRVQGEAQKSSDADKVAVRIEPGMQLHVGDTLATDAGSSLTLKFVDGSRLLIAEKSRLTLSSLQVYGKTGMTDTRLKLFEGGVETQVAPQNGPAAKYEVKAPTLHLGVRGTDFRVRVNNTTTLSEVLKGRVAATGERHQVLLNPGFGTMADAGQPPHAPKALLKPPDAGSTSTRLERVPLRFKWQAVPGAQSYRAQVFADHAFDLILLDGTFAENSAKWVDLPDGKYVLRVRAIDGNGMEGINADHDFTLKARPESPFINAPVGGGKVYGDKAVLSWAKSTIAHSYHVQLSGTQDFSTLLDDRNEITASEHAVPLPPGQYYWRIASRMADGDQGPYSDSHAFTLRKIPASPTVEPPKMDDKALSFHWNAGGDGEKYQFQLSKDEAFSNPLQDTVTAESGISLQKPAAGTYFMHVKTIDADGFAGSFGQTQLVKIPPPAPWWLLLPLLFM